MEEILINIFYVLLIAVNFGLFVKWLIDTRWLKQSFPEAHFEEHTIEAQDVLLVFIVLFAPGLLGQGLINRVELDKWQENNYMALALAGGQCLAVMTTLYLARLRFPGGLKGFGFKTEQPLRFVMRFLGYTLTVSGLTFMTLGVTLAICRYYGYETVQVHPFLELLSENPPLLTKILLFINPAVLAPIAEELIFRGMLQNSIRKFLLRLFNIVSPSSSAKTSLDKPVPEYVTWAAIVISSFIFAVFHGNWQHWPALTVLSVGLGYCYQRFGTLWLPIAIHAAFNLVPLSLTLLKHFQSG